MSTEKSSQTKIFSNFYLYEVRLGFFSIDRRQAVQDNGQNFWYLFCMFRRFFLFFSCLLMALLFCALSLPAASNPPDYERAKAQLARLHQGKHSAAEWQACANAFRSAYEKNPKWHLRVAALYRCGVALEGRARVTGNTADARRAASTYEQAIRTYPHSALTDDALFRAALVYNELLREPVRARGYLERIGRQYAKSDHAKVAADYKAKMDARKGAKAAKPAPKEPPKKPVVTPEPKKVPLHKEKAKKVDLPAPAPKKAEKTAPKSSIKPERAPAPTGKPIAHNLAAQLGLAVRTVVIDAGHGGKDPGAVHHGVVEKDVNLDVAKRLGDILRKRGYTVKFTRDKNSWLSLGERVRYGKKSEGDLFVSIHVNACDNPKASGFETYILDFARTSSASRLAAIENANSGRLGDMDNVLTEILRGARTAESRRLADHIQGGTLDYLRKRGFKVQNGGVKGAPFFVLVGSSMPSVLVEVGYCSNKAEAVRLKSQEYRQQLAQGIASGIVSYAQRLSLP